MKPSDLYSKIIEILEDDYKHTSTSELTEDGTKATCRRVKIVTKGKTSIYKFDKQGKNDIFPFYKNIQQVKTMSDYIAFVSNDTHIHVFICNLKSGNSGNNLQQIKAAFFFAKFIVGTAVRLLKCDDIPDYVIFKAISFRSVATSNLTRVGKKVGVNLFKGLEGYNHHCNQAFYFGSYCEKE